MNHWERVLAAVHGEPTDRPPISLWRHFPVEDLTAQGLARLTVEWQKKYDFDLIKLCPTGTYMLDDYGGESAYDGNQRGTRIGVEFPIGCTSDWTKLPVLDVTKGFMGAYNEALKLVHQGTHGSVPIVQTIFSPLTTAWKIAGDRVFADLRIHQAELKQGLETIAETTLQFALEALKAGASGVFFATKLANHRSLSIDEYKEFGEPYDRLILEGLPPSAQIQILHIHGEDIMFEYMAEYPVNAISWHDQTTFPSFSEARQYFQGLLVGGINEWQTLLPGPVEAIRNEIENAMSMTGGRGFMFAPGCVLPIDVPERHLEFLREEFSRITKA